MEQKFITTTAFIRAELYMTSINFNAAQISSGVYLCRLEAGKLSETKSMILVK
jgi:hypothetical protein